MCTLDIYPLYKTCWGSKKAQNVKKDPIDSTNNALLISCVNAGEQSADTLGINWVYFLFLNVLQSN